MRRRTNLIFNNTIIKMNIFQLFLMIPMIHGLVAGQPHVNIMTTIDTLKHMTDNELLQEF